MTDFLSDLSCMVSDHNLVLNILLGLNKRYDHLQVITMHNTPFPAFHKVWDELVLEDITLTPDTPAAPRVGVLLQQHSRSSPAQPHPPWQCWPGSRGHGHDRDGDISTSNQVKQGQGSQVNPDLTS
jgi:hypothetical protein